MVRNNTENNQLIEPAIWIEYQRVNMNNDTFARRSLADAIHRHRLMPNGCIVRGWKDARTGESVWEYRM